MINTSDTDQSWRTDLYAILINPEYTAVWLQSVEGRWGLPALQLPERLWIRVPNEINQAWQTKFDLPVTVLYCAHYQMNSESRHVELLHVLESHQSAVTPPIAGQWVTAVALEQLPLAPPEHRPLIKRPLRKQPVTPCRPSVHPGLALGGCKKQRSGYNLS
jgi:hypothetical protein